jgi:putative hydrolase
VHSTFSDDAVSTLAENVAAAAARGLTAIRLIDHVRVDTAWVPAFLAAVRDLDIPDSLTVRTGVEAKILDASGRLDIPADLVVGPGGVDGIVIADHQFPGPDGPWSPARTQAELAAGLRSAEAVATLVRATIAAMERAGGGAQLAHPFSILPKVGLAEADIDDALLREWAEAAARTGTSIEVNEKWGCPGPRAVRAARAAGAALVASTDSHRADDVGRYDRVAAILEAAG